MLNTNHKRTMLYTCPNCKRTIRWKGKSSTKYVDDLKATPSTGERAKKLKALKEEARTNMVDWFAGEEIKRSEKDSEGH